MNIRRIVSMLTRLEHRLSGSDIHEKKKKLLFSYEEQPGYPVPDSSTTLPQRETLVWSWITVTTEYPDVWPFGQYELIQ